jgi:hypothetical protein
MFLGEDYKCKQDAGWVRKLVVNFVDKTRQMILTVDVYTEIKYTHQYSDIDGEKQNPFGSRSSTEWHSNRGSHG